LALACSPTKTDHWQPKSVKNICRSFRWDHFFLSLCCRVRTKPWFLQLLHIENHVFAIAVAFKNFILFFPARALSDDSAASHLHSDSGSARPRRYIYSNIWITTYQFSLMFLLTAPHGSSDRPTNNSPQLNVSKGGREKNKYI
jgi:hypothetical protein